MRPRLHYTPRLNWMNDPNGLIFHRGVYHLFYQYNPHGTVWGHMSWGHASSVDLLTWREHPVALHEDERHAIFSGSIVADPDGRAGFGRGALVATYTGHAVGPPPRQTQNLAWSEDDGLSWTKYGGNPVLDLGQAEFRDPKVFWHTPSARWVMVVARPDLREVLFYASSDLRGWQELSAFGPAGTPGRLWECPDLIRLRTPDGGERWVLKVDVFEGAVAGGSGGLAFIGTFDGSAFTPDRGHDGGPAWQWLDHGRDFYAAASWAGLPEGEAIWIAWMNSHHYARHMPDQPWRGSMTLPRLLGLALQDGRVVLTQRPVPVLRASEVMQHEMGPFDAPGGLRLALVGSVADVEARFDPQAATGCRLELSREDGGSVVVTHDAATGRLTLDRDGVGVLPDVPHFAGAVSAPTGVLTDLRLVVDVGSIEIFANGGAVTITEQILGTTPFDTLVAAGCYRSLHVYG